MARHRRRSAGPTYHLEPGAAGTRAFFIVGLSTVNRIEIVRISLDYVIFRVVYPHRSHRFGFRFRYPCVYRAYEQTRIRLSPETYRELYRLADVLMQAVLAGYCPTYTIRGKGYHWLNSGDRFKICSLRKRELVVAVEGVSYAFVHDDGMYFMRGSDEAIAPPLRTFLHRFAPLVMDAYAPYERVPGELLDPLALFPEHETEPPRKRRRMRMREKEAELKRLGKPARAVAKKRPLAPPTGNLFEPRTLRS